MWPSRAESRQVSQALHLSASDLDKLCGVHGRIDRDVFVSAVGGMIGTHTSKLQIETLRAVAHAEALHSATRAPATSHAPAGAASASVGKQSSFEMAQQEAREIAQQLEVLAEQHVSACQPELVADSSTAENALCAALARTDSAELELLLARFSGRLGAEHALVQQALRMLRGVKAEAASDMDCRWMVRCTELMRLPHDTSTIETLRILEEEMVTAGVTVRKCCAALRVGCVLPVAARCVQPMRY